MLQTLDLCTSMSRKSFCDKVLQGTMGDVIYVWRNSNQNDVGTSGRGRNKLRTYILFKQDYMIEPYVKSFLSSKYRSALAKFRCGVAPLKLETGRYENIPENQRVCPICKVSVETEIHVLFECNAYQELRDMLNNKACDVENTNVNFTKQEKLNFVLSNTNLVNITAKTCYLILKSRNNLLYR